MLSKPELLLAVDRFQSNSPEAVSCLKDASHGKLTMHGTLNSIACGICGTHYPLTPEFMKAITEFKK